MDLRTHRGLSILDQIPKAAVAEAAASRPSTFFGFLTLDNRLAQCCATSEKLDAYGAFQTRQQFLELSGAARMPRSAGEQLRESSGMGCRSSL